MTECYDSRCLVRCARRKRPIANARLRPLWQCHHIPCDYYLPIQRPNMLLTYNDLLVLVEEGVIENVDPANINGASIDLTLGATLQVEEVPFENWPVIDLQAKDSIHTARVLLDPTEYYDLQQGEFVLAQTQEIFHLPTTIAAEFKLKSSAARAGLDHHLAGWADPGWHGSVLTLELKNNTQHHVLRLRPGMKIGQMVFWKGEAVPDDASYAVRGQYNHDKEATANKGIR